MTKQIIAGELHRSIMDQLSNLERQLGPNNGYPFNPVQLEQTLASIVEGKFPNQGYEPYLSLLQQSGEQITIYALEQELKDHQLMSRAKKMSFNTPLVKAWLENPATYPSGLKNGLALLWGSQRSSDMTGDSIGCLSWIEERGIVRKDWTRYFVGWHCPVLLEIPRTPKTAPKP